MNHTIVVTGGRPWNSIPACFTHSSASITDWHLQFAPAGLEGQLHPQARPGGHCGLTQAAIASKGSLNINAVIAFNVMQLLTQIILNWMNITSDVFSYE